MYRLVERTFSKFVFRVNLKGVYYAVTDTCYVYPYLSKIEGKLC